MRRLCPDNRYHPTAARMPVAVDLERDRSAAESETELNAMNVQRLYSGGDHQLRADDMRDGKM